MKYPLSIVLKNEFSKFIYLSVGLSVNTSGPIPAIPFTAVITSFKILLLISDSVIV